MSFAKTNLSRAHDVQESSDVVYTDQEPRTKRRKKQALPTKASVQENHGEGEITISTKRIVGESKNHVWIYMKGTGVVNLDLVMAKMDELQEILDSIQDIPLMQFTFAFDFRSLEDFCDYKTLFKFGAFMKRNHELFEERLRMSYLLLRKWTWRAVVQLLFAAFPPTKPVEFSIPSDVDEAICTK